jgi:hypothetical protein
MTMTPLPAVIVTPVAYFPEYCFLENLAVRADGSVLVTTIQKKVQGRERTTVPRTSRTWRESTSTGGPRASRYPTTSSSPSMIGSGA